ncbi:MAG: hypothetical protein ABIJ38_00625 [Patescibacteria group bacterium]
MKTKKTKRATVKRRAVASCEVKSMVPFNSRKLVPLILVTSLLFLFFALLAWVVGIKSQWLSTQDAVSASVMQVRPIH